jgi:dTMP kinase
MLISFEGIDGSGKSTQAQLLQSELVEHGFRVLLVREPGGTDVSERVRDILLDKTLDIDPFAEMLLFSAARAQLVRTSVQAALDDDTVVICDRFFDSTIAYQGAGRGIADTTWLTEFQLNVTDGLIPERTYLVEVAPKVAERRLIHRDESRASVDRMESAGQQFFSRVAKAYESIANAEPDRIVVIDGSGTQKQVAELIREDFRSKYPRFGL